MNLQENISTQLRRRTHLVDSVIKNLLPNMYPCDYNSSDHFVEGVLDEIRWFLGDSEELQGIERMDIENYILDYKYDELTDYFNEHCIVLKNDNLQEHIRKVLREETDELGERTKLEKLIAKQFIKPGPDLENVLLEPDNYYGVVVDIYNTDYGRQCHITVLMKKPFKSEDSDMLHNMIRKGRERVKDMFSNLFKGGITSSVSTIHSYKDHKWFYDERKKY